MSETVSVSISGAAFSLLYFENIKSEYNQEGFLLGDIISKETNKVTDADYRVVNKERIIKVKSIIPLPQQFYYYNAAGEIDVEKIRDVVGDQESKVIGWYIYKRKRFTGSRLTLREKLIHKQLTEMFNPQLSYFTCCLLTSENSNIKSTYSLCQTFVRYYMSRYESLPIHVVNLSDPNFTFKSAEPVSETVSKVLKDIKRTGGAEGHSIIQKVQDGLQRHMKNLVEESIGKEQQLFALEQRVGQLKQNLKSTRDNGVPENDLDQSLSEKQVMENGAYDSTCSQNSQEGDAESSPEFPKKRRGRSRKNVSPLQSNSVNKDSGKICDAAGDIEENVVKPVKTRSKANHSYAEIAQKSKN